MMHATQKSDSPVVAVKLANKPERLRAGSGAEPVEPRGGARGNAGQPRMCRTQGRDSVLQRLDRVRQAARQRKKERFTARMHLVDVELLRQSYFWLQRNAAAGVDGVTWHISGCDRRGKWLLRRITRRDRKVAALKRIKANLRRRWHQSTPEQGRWLRSVVQGYMAYHAVPGNDPGMKAFRRHVTNPWRRALKRRGERDKTKWRRAFKLAAQWLPRARILHPWPNQRFDATRPRQEPGARIAPAGIRAGGAR